MNEAEVKKAVKEEREPKVITFYEPVQIHELITTDSRPLRTNYIKTVSGGKYKDRITILPLANSIKTIFADIENKEYYGRFSIKN
jgi:hypothetical protein